MWGLACSRLGKRYLEPVARRRGNQASTELLDCSVISNWTGRPVFFWTIVARCRTLVPEQTSSNRSLTKSQARSLLSIARLKIARSRLDRAISSRTRMDQTCFGSRGFFWPMSNPLFQGRCPRSTGHTGIGGPPPSRPPRRSIATGSFIPKTGHCWRRQETLAELRLAFWASIGFKPSDFITTDMNEKQTVWLCHVSNRVAQPPSLMRSKLF
jgi:hypothetical protein